MAAPLLTIPVTPAAMLAAVACVIAGGPWFADGLRALRQRRALGALGAAAGVPLHEGPVAARGSVVLASPLFAPLSGRPCAGYVLEVGCDSVPLVGRLLDRRSFRLTTADGLAEVEAGEAWWDLRVGAVRTFASPAELSENLAVMLTSTPELRWLLARGGGLVLRERALFAGDHAVVLGVAERLQGAAVAATATLARTGTDDTDWVVDEPASAAAPAWRIGAAEPFERCVVSDGAPEAGRFALPAWRLLGAVLGPALSLAGLLVLAEAAGHALDRGY